MLTFSLDRLQVELDGARHEVTHANKKLVEAVHAARAARRVERSLLAAAARSRRLSTRLEREKRAVQAGFRAYAATEAVEKQRELLETAQAALDAARAGAAPASMAPQAGLLLGTPSFAGGYAFPVGGGPAVVNVGFYHHDYPAADIAAPMGAPLYALAEGVVSDAWPLPSGNCGIGFVLQTLDGREWTYCHLSYLEPAVQPGAMFTAGTPVGLVGSTGHSTGPHLHLQTGPALTYPQQEGWFRAFAGTAFSWQGDETAQPYAVAPFASAPVFAVVEQRVFEVVEEEESPDGVIEFSLTT